MRGAEARARQAELAGAASIFAALGDEMRLRLVSRLCDVGPLSIARLADGFPITRQAVSKHLRVMEGAGLVRSTARGRESIWQLEQQHLADAQRYLETISSRWDQVLGRLKRFVEQA